MLAQALKAAFGRVGVADGVLNQASQQDAEFRRPILEAEILIRGIAETFTHIVNYGVDGARILAFHGAQGFAKKLHHF